MVQTDYALDQRAQDNKFVESGLRNWTLANMATIITNFEDSFNENNETNGKISLIRETPLLYQEIFFICHSR